MTRETPGTCCMMKNGFIGSLNWLQVLKQLRSSTDK